MRGAKLNIRILTFIALSLGLLMAILNLYPSWSQTAGTIHDPLLYTTLFCIATTFTISSFTNLDRNKEISKIKFIGSFKLGHCHRVVSYMFGGVIAFSVNSEFWLIETLHLAFTGLAIAIGYLGLMMYPTTKRGHTLSLVGTLFGCLGFLGAFLFHFYSIAWGEVLAALPLAIWVNTSFKGNFR